MANLWDPFSMQQIFHLNIFLHRFFQQNDMCLPSVVNFAWACSLNSLNGENLQILLGNKMALCEILLFPYHIKTILVQKLF